MLNFIKNLFAKKESEKEIVKLENLNEWFNAKSDIIYNDLRENISLIKNKINSEIEETRLNLNKLKEAKLQNPNIPIRAKQMMDGNRTSYIKIISNFVDNIKLGSEHKELLVYCNNFDNSLDSLGKSTLRSYHILKEFFEHEARDIAINIKNIDKSFKEIKSIIENSNMNKIEAIKNNITNVKNKIRQKSVFIEELKNNEEELNKIGQEKEILLKDIGNIKISEEYKNFNNLKKEKEAILEKIKIKEDVVFQSFSALNRPLRKFSRITLEEERLLNNYVENPINTLSNDKELKIIKILEGLEKNLIQDRIELDGKRKNKALIGIRKLNKEFFIDFLENYNDLKDKLKNIEGKIENSGIKSKYAELNEELNNLNDNIEKINSEIENFKKEIEKINIEKLKLNLQDEINKAIKMDIIIS